MIRILAASLAIALSFPAPASDTGAFAAAGDPNGAFYIVLTREPCPADMLARVNAGSARFFLAKERFQGRDIRACWALNPPIVLIFDEDGDKGAMRMDEFKPVSGS